MPPKEIKKTGQEIKRSSNSRSNDNLFTHEGLSLRSEKLTGNSSDGEPSFLHQESLTPGRHFEGRQQQVTTEQKQLQVYNDIFDSVENILSTTAERVDVLKNVRIESPGDLEKQLPELCQLKEDISNEISKLFPIITSMEYTDKLQLKIEQSKTKLSKQAFAQLGEIETFIEKTESRLQDSAKHQQNGEQKQTEKSPFSDSRLEGFWERFWEGFRQELATKQARLKAHNDILGSIEQTLASTADKGEMLKHWRITTVEKAIIDPEARPKELQKTISDLEGHLNDLRKMEMDISAAEYGLTPLSSLTKKELDEFQSIIESDEFQSMDSQTTEKLFMQSVDELHTLSQKIEEKKLTLSKQAKSQLEEIHVAIKTTESKLQDARKYYNRRFSGLTVAGSDEYSDNLQIQNPARSSGQTLVDEYSSDQQKVSSDVEDAIEVLKQKIAEDLDKYIEIMIKSHDIIEDNIAITTEIAYWASGYDADNIDNKGELWRQMHPEVPPRNTNTIYDQIYTSERLKNTFENILHKSLPQARSVMLDTMNELYQVTSAVTKSQHNKLQIEFERIDTHVTIRSVLQDIENLYERLLEYNKFKIDLIEYIDQELKKIYKNEQDIEKKLQEATERYQKDLKQKPREHPFFKDADMLETQANTEFVPRERLFGANMANVLKTLLKLKHQGINVSEDDIARRLDLHPFDGRIGAKPETFLPDLRVQSGLQYKEIEVGDLKDALSKGPIAAYLDKARSDVPQAKGFEQFVILKRDPNTREDYVVVLDELRKKTYEIHIEKFAKAWTGKVFALRDALP